MTRLYTLVLYNIKVLLWNLMLSTNMFVNEHFNIHFSLFFTVYVSVNEIWYTFVSGMYLWKLQVLYEFDNNDSCYVFQLYRHHSNFDVFHVLNITLQISCEVWRRRLPLCPTLGGSPDRAPAPGPARNGPITGWVLWCRAYRGSGEEGRGLPVLGGEGLRGTEIVSTPVLCLLIVRILPLCSIVRYFSEGFRHFRIFM